MKLFRLILCLSFIATVSAQDVVVRGQLWGSTLAGDDPAEGMPTNAQLIGYIPTLSVGYSFSRGLIDMEVAHRLAYESDFESTITSSISKAHRYWVRFSNDKVELRLGLQKIAFGPAMVLRPLSWFDTIDLEDPTGQTDGVNAFRVKYYANDNMVFWGWALKQKGVGLGMGGRVEFSLPSTEVGITYHAATDVDSTVVPAASPSGIMSDMSRLALDLRYDGYFGLWLETVLTLPENEDGGLFTTIGADFTLPIVNGILVIVEHMTYPDPFDKSASAAFTAAMAGLPLGMFDNVTAIAYYDWNNKRLTNYLRYSRTYDALSINLMVSTSPRRNSYGEAFQEILSRQSKLAGFGTTISLMLIYNH